MSELIKALDWAEEVRKKGKEFKPCSSCGGVPDRESSFKFKNYICKQCFDLKQKSVMRGPGN
jgi:hypothetical protein